MARPSGTPPRNSGIIASAKACASSSKIVISVPITPAAAVFSTSTFTRFSACAGEIAVVWQPLINISGRACGHLMRKLPQVSVVK